ncbi:MAG: hypothetical protein U0936_18345 [Planctomycetaceae bacterium]
MLASADVHLVPSESSLMAQWRVDCVLCGVVAGFDRETGDPDHRVEGD